MFCPHCGKSVTTSVKFCPFCGTSVNLPHSSATQANDPPTPSSTGTQPTYPPQPYVPPAYVPPYTAPVQAKASTIKRPNAVALIGVAAFFVSMFLPFFTISAMGVTQSAAFVSFFSSESPVWMMVIMILCMLVIVLLQVAKAPQPVTVVVSALSLICLLIFVGMINGAIGDAMNAYDANSSTLLYYGITKPDLSSSFSFGFWIMLLSHIVILLSSPLYKAFLKNKTR